MRWSKYVVNFQRDQDVTWLQIYRVLRLYQRCLAPDQISYSGTNGPDGGRRMADFRTRCGKCSRCQLNPTLTGLDGYRCCRCCGTRVHGDEGRWTFRPRGERDSTVLYDYLPNKTAGLSSLVLVGLTTLRYPIYFLRLGGSYLMPYLLGGMSKSFYSKTSWRMDNMMGVSWLLMQPLIFISYAYHMSNI